MKPTAERDPESILPDPARPPADVVVVGAGLSGAAAARTLADAGCRVRVLEKSRGPGGRMATRHADGGDFDHGAQYFTARDPRFKAWVADACRRGHVAAWPQAGPALRCGEAAWVGTPCMNTLAGVLLADRVELTTRAEVVRMQSSGGRWQLLDAAGRLLAEADAVVVSAPAPQAARLLAPLPRLARLAAQVRMQPCWALRVVLRAGIVLAAASGAPDRGPVAWWALNNAKPGRPEGVPHLVVHAGVEFSNRWLEADPAEVPAKLLPGLLRSLGLQPGDVVSVDAHRWRYARVERPLGVDALHDPAAGVVAVGDWCLGPRVECAWLSGVAGADRLLGRRGGAGA